MPTVSDCARSWKVLGGQGGTSQDAWAGGWERVTVDEVARANRRLGSQIHQ